MKNIYKILVVAVVLAKAFPLTAQTPISQEMCGSEIAAELPSGTTFLVLPALPSGSFDLNVSNIVEVFIDYSNMSYVGPFGERIITLKIELKDSPSKPNQTLLLDVPVTHNPTDSEVAQLKYFMESDYYFMRVTLLDVFPPFPSADGLTRLRDNICIRLTMEYERYYDFSSNY